MNHHITQIRSRDVLFVRVKSIPNKAAIVSRNVFRDDAIRFPQESQNNFPHHYYFIKSNKAHQYVKRGVRYLEIERDSLGRSMNVVVGHPALLHFKIPSGVWRIYYSQQYKKGSVKKVRG